MAMNLHEWKSEVHALKHGRGSTTKVITNFNDFVEGIARHGVLPEPFADETEVFLGYVTPEIISEIMRSYGMGEACERAFASLLKGYLRIAGSLLTSVPDQFIESVTKVLGDTRAPFYTNKSKVLSGRDAGHHVANVQVFVATGPLKVMREKWNGMMSVSQIRKLIACLLPVCDYFSPPERSCWGVFVADRLMEMAQSTELKDLNEKEYDTSFSGIATIVAESEARQVVLERRLHFALAISMADVLTKLVCGMNAIASLISQVRDAAVIIQEAGVVEHCLETGVHVELALLLGTILNNMVSSGCVTTQHVKRFWEIAVLHNHQAGTVYMNGIALAVENMPIEEFVDIVIDVNRYPDDALVFLAKIGDRYTVPAKRKLFERMQCVYFDEENNTPRICLLLEIMGTLLTDDVDEVCSQIRCRCVSMIERREKVDIAIPMFKLALRSASSERVTIIFDDVVTKRCVTSAESLEILATLVHKLGDSISESALSKVKEITSTLIPECALEVCTFYFNILGGSTRHDQLLRDAFMVMGSLDSYPESVINTIRESCKKLTIEEREMYGSRVLWNIARKTADANVIDDLVCHCLLDSDDKKVENYIEICFQDLRCVGGLSALKRLIIVVEDGCMYQTNRFIFDEDYCVVNMRRKPPTPGATIMVPSDMSFDGFVRIVADTFGVKQNSVLLSWKDARVHAENFDQLPKKRVTLNVTLTSGKATKDTKDRRVTSVLVAPKYSDVLIEVLRENVPEQSQIALEILNRMPTVPQEIIAEFDAARFFCVNEPFLMAYRMNTLCNLLHDNSSFGVDTFGVSGVLALINIVMAYDHATVELNASLWTFFTRATNWILILDCMKTIRDETVDLTRHRAHILLDFVAKTTIGSLRAQILRLLLNYGSCVTELDGFTSLAGVLMFQTNAAVRKTLCDIIRTVSCGDARRELVMYHLKDSCNSNCAEYFGLVSDLAEHDSTPEVLWKETVQFMYTTLGAPGKVDTMELLRAERRPESFVNGLLHVAKILISRIDVVVDIESLFDFMTTQVMFNEARQYGRNSDVFMICSALIEKQSNLADAIFERLLTLQKMPLVNKKQTNSTSTFNTRGIQNLGATCYMNSIIQQLFNIPEFTEILLRSPASDELWFTEMRCMFLKLMLFPSSYIESGDFVSKWKDHDGTVINPRRQQDAVEFLQLLLDRVEYIVPGITDMFRCTIKRLPLNMDTGEANMESFSTFPLDVKGFDNVDDSIKAFMSQTDEDCLRGFHCQKIVSAPAVLILQLKRFSWNVERGRRYKLNSKFDVPAVLDLTETMECATSPVVYDLCGVVVHMGSSEAGHYYSNVKVIDKDKWFCVNDTKVTETDEATVQLDASGGKEMIRVFETAMDGIRDKVLSKNTSGYLLFYRNRSTPVPKDGCCDVSQDIRDKLVLELRNESSSELVFSREFPVLMMGVCEAKKTWILLYDYAMLYLHNRLDVRMMIDKLRECCTSDVELCDHILRQRDDFNTLLISGISVARQCMRDLLLAALGHCTRDASFEFVNSIYESLTVTCSFLLSHHQCFSEFFELVGYIDTVTEIHDPETCFCVVAEFLCGAIPAYARDHNSEFFATVDMCSMFQLMTMLIKSDRIAATVGGDIFRSPSFSDLCIARRHVEGLSGLIMKLLSTPCNSGILMEVIRANRVSGRMMALVFRIALVMEHVQLQDCIFDIISSKDNPASPEFLLAFAESPAYVLVMFEAVSGKWVCPFILSFKDEERVAVNTLIIKMFTEASDLSVALIATIKVIIWHIRTLSVMLRKFGEHVTKLATGATPSSSLLPMIRRLVECTGWINEFNGAIYESVQLASAAAKCQVVDLPSDVIDFIFGTFGNKVFSTIPATRFLNYFDGCIISKKLGCSLISNVPDELAADMFRSSAFSKICLGCFDQRCLSEYIMRVKSEDAVRDLCGVMWLRTCFIPCSRASGTRWFSCSRRVLHTFPSVSNIFEKHNVHTFLWGAIMRNSAISLQMAIVLAEFNRSYAAVNHGKFQWGTKKTHRLSGFYEEQGFNSREILSIAQSVRKDQWCSGGFLEFLESMCVLRKKLALSISSLIMKQSGPFIPRFRSQRSAVRLVVRLWKRLHSNDLYDFMLSEFNSCSERFESIDEFCAAFIAMNDQTLLTTIHPTIVAFCRSLPCPSDLHRNLHAAILDTFTLDEALPVREAVVRLAATAINAYPDISSTGDIQTLGDCLSSTDNFLSRFTGRFLTPRVPISVAPEHVDKLTICFLSDPKTEKYASLLANLLKN